MDMRIFLRDDSDGRWLYFDQPLEIVAAHHLDEILPKLRYVEARVKDEGMYAAGFLTYEAAPAFDPALRVHAPGRLPLMHWGLYRRPRKLDYLPDPEAGSYTLGTPTPDISEDDYQRSIHSIKASIAQGDTYQVNFTFRLRASFQGDVWRLFHTMQQAQQAPFGAFIETDGFAICSASPELFFALEGARLRSRPMKGTTRRGHNLAADEALMQWLRDSEKNRAENVMIVDMVRNDMGRVAEFGSVHVPDLFTVERYPTVLQMTSTVQAQTQASVTEILQALFPCASITGAPKVRTMEIIHALEPGPRGVYTGAIGFISPPSAEIPRRAQFNVAIRTAYVDKINGRAEYGVGSGIVWDSMTGLEYHECQMKARVLADPPPAFSIFESLLWEPDAGFFLLERHLQRLSAAAAYFVIPLDVAQAQEMLANLAGGFQPQPHKVRLLAAQDGRLRCEAAPIDPSTSRQPVRLGLAHTPIRGADPYLFYKTTHRKVYEEALAGRPDCDDVLLWNERGEITESSRANVVVKLGGEWLTPPVESGLLAGTYRAELLARGAIKTRVLRLQDLEQAEAIYLINSVRRWLQTSWVDARTVDERRASPAVGVVNKG